MESLQVFTLEYRLICYSHLIWQINTLFSILKKKKKKTLFSKLKPLLIFKFNKLLDKLGHGIINKFVTNNLQCPTHKTSVLLLIVTLIWMMPCMVLSLWNFNKIRGLYVALQRASFQKNEAFGALPRLTSGKKYSLYWRLQSQDIG